MFDWFKNLLAGSHQADFLEPETSTDTVTTFSADEQRAQWDSALGGGNNFARTGNIEPVTNRNGGNVADTEKLVDTRHQLEAMAAGIIPNTESHDNSGETAETQNNALLVPDLSLLHGYGHPEEEGQEIPVGITRFQKGKKILDFVTVEHTGSVQDATHRTINEAITKGNPQVVITEGHATDMPDEAKKGIIEWTKREVEKVQNNNNVQEPNTYIPEAGYAAYLAAEQGITSVGGEISGNEFLVKMQEHGYSAEDMLAVQFMRQLETISPENRATMTEEEFVANHAQRLLAEANNIVNPQHHADIEPLTLNRFKKWYDTTRPLGDRNFLSVGHEDFVPHQNGEYLNKMACESGLVRDEHIAELLGDLINQNDHVTIVYGTGHLSSFRPLLEALFGSPGKLNVLDEDSTPKQAA